MPNFRDIKISVFFIRGTKRPSVRGNYCESSDCFEYPKISPYLNQATSKKILAKIFLPKKISKSKLSKTGKSFDHPCHFKSGVTPLGLWPYDIAVNSAVKHSFSLALCAFSIALNNYLCY